MNSRNRVMSYMISYSSDGAKWTEYRESGAIKVSIPVGKGSNSYMIVQCYFLVFIERISKLGFCHDFACGSDVTNEEVTEVDKSYPKASALSMRSKNYSCYIRCLYFYV